MISLIFFWTSLSVLCVLWRLSHKSFLWHADLTACIYFLLDLYFSFSHPQSFITILLKGRVTPHLIQTLGPNLKFIKMIKILPLLLCWLGRRVSWKSAGYHTQTGLKSSVSIDLPLKGICSCPWWWSLGTLSIYFFDFLFFFAVCLSLVTAIAILRNVDT